MLRAALLQSPTLPWESLTVSWESLTRSRGQARQGVLFVTLFLNGCESLRVSGNVCGSLTVSCNVSEAFMKVLSVPGNV